MNEKQNMKDWLEWLEGKRTYLTCLMAGVLLFGSWQGWWRLPSEAYAGLAALATACLRASLSRELNALKGGGANNPESNPPPPAAGGGKIVALLLAAGLGAAALTGCGTLDPAGPYQGNKVLYAADLTLTDTYDALHAFVQWEYENRAALAGQPSIREAADQLRSSAPRWFAAALAARDAYAAAGTPARQAALESALTVIQAAVTQAAGLRAANPAPLPAAGTNAPVGKPTAPPTAPASAATNSSVAPPSAPTLNF